MTMTEARPEEATVADQPASTPAPGADLVVDSADHKKVGLVFLVLSLLAFLLVRGVGATLGAELVSTGSQVVGGNGRKLFSIYETGIVLLWAAPVWIGLATYLLPLQIGSARLAFPRLQALALWAHVAGAGLFLVGHLVSASPGLTGFGLSGRTAIEGTVEGTNGGTNVILVGFLVLGLASLLAAGNLVATALTLRAEGMTLGRMPLFAWAIVATGAVLLISLPVFLAGGFLLFVDLHFGGFGVFGGRGGELVWQKSLWLYGRPEILLLAIPGLGAACDIVSHAAKGPIADPPQPPLPAKLAAKAPTPPSGHVLAMGAIAAAAGLTLLTWAQDHATLGAVVLPTASVGTALVVVPVGLLALSWLGTLGLAKATPTPAVGFVLAALLVWVVAGANAVVAAIAHVHGTAFSQGEIELVAIGAPTLLAFGALHHWAPKLFGTKLSPVSAGLATLLGLAGTLALGVGLSVAGYAGASEHVTDVSGLAHAADARTGFGIAQAGQVLLLVAGVVLLLDVARAIATGRRGEPTPARDGDGITLEWAASSPPPATNFVEVPEVRSPAPLLDVRAAKGGK